MPGILLLVVVCFQKVLFCFPKLSLHVIYIGAGCNLQRLSKKHSTQNCHRQSLGHLSQSWAWSIFPLLPERKVLAPVHLLYYIWDEQRRTLCWIHQGRILVILVCFVRCINTYYFMCLLFKHFQLLPCLKYKREYVVLQINTVVHFRSYHCLFPLRLID